MQKPSKKLNTIVDKTINIDKKLNIIVDKVININKR